MDRDAPEFALYRSGSTEPWSVDIMCAMIRALQPKRLLELGSYLGLTTGKLAEAMPATATLHTVEGDFNRFQHCLTRFEGIPNVICYQADTLAFLRQWPADQPFDFVFVDDDHAKDHVAQELDLLLDPNKPLVAPKGLVVCHDVCGYFGLAPVVTARHGWVLDLPLLHVAGGLGFIQRSVL